jgi:hypothetical protein
MHHLLVVALIIQLRDPTMGKPSPPPQGLEQGDHFFRAHSWRTESSSRTLLSSTLSESSWIMYLYVSEIRASPSGIT